MERLVRESFVRVYNNDQFLIELFDNINLRALEEYINQSGKSVETIKEDEIKIKLPKYPKTGKLDIKEVLESKYFIN
jgi:DNA-directed RNA polymerase